MYHLSCSIKLHQIQFSHSEKFHIINHKAKLIFRTLRLDHITTENLRHDHRNMNKIITEFRFRKFIREPLQKQPFLEFILLKNTVLKQP